MSNPITDKILAYVTRMEELIHEAYKDGVLLQTLPTEPTIGTLPVLDGQGVYHACKYLGLREHQHLHLTLPLAVKASALTVKGQDNQPAALIPSLKIPMPVDTGK